MAREYFRCLFTLDGLQSLLIWYSNDRDGVYRNSSGMIPTFPSVDALDSYAEAAGLPLNRETPVLQNLDSVEQFIAGDGELDCNEVLETWNLFGDVAKSIGGDGAAYCESDRSLDVIYDKIFFGCNLPSITPKGEEYIPYWSSDELDEVKEHLRIGFSMFRQATGSQGNKEGVEANA